MKMMKAPKVDEKMVHDPFKKSAKKTTVVKKAAGSRTLSRSLALCVVRWGLKKAKRFRQRNSPQQPRSPVKWDNELD